MEREGGGKVGEFPHAMTSGEGSKPLPCPHAQENQLSWHRAGQSRARWERETSGPMVGPRRDGDGPAGRPAGRAHGPPTPRVSPPTFCLARRSTVKNTLCRNFSRKSKRENALSLPCPAINALFVSQNVGSFRYSMISRYPRQNPDFT